MTPEQFMYWLEGRLADAVALDAAAIVSILEQIKAVRAPKPAPQGLTPRAAELRPDEKWQRSAPVAPVFTLAEQVARNYRHSNIL